MNKLKNIVFLIVSSIFYFWLYTKILFDYLLSLAGRYYHLIQSLFVAIIFTLVASILTFLIYIQVSKRMFHKIFVYCFYGAYVLITGGLLIGRHYSFRAIELNPLGFISYFGQPGGGFVNFTNIILFIPFGVLMHKMPNIRVFLISLISILMIEIIQYIFYLGVFDLSDMILNLYGIYLGLSIGRYFSKKGIKVVSSFKCN